MSCANKKTTFEANIIASYSKQAVGWLLVSLEKIFDFSFSAELYLQK